MSDKNKTLQRFLTLPLSNKAKIMLKMSECALRYLDTDKRVYELASYYVKNLRQYVSGANISPDELEAALDHPSDENQNLLLQATMKGVDEVTVNVIDVICYCIAYIAHHEFMKAGRYKDMSAPVNEVTDDVLGEMLDSYFTLTGKYPEIS